MREPAEIKHLVPTKWQWMVSYPENLVISTECDIGAFTYINARYGVVIEDDVQIGAHCAIYSDNTINGTQGMVRIKKGAKIGAQSVILPGVTIGRNAMCGAFSLIARDVPDNGRVKLA